MLSSHFNLARKMNGFVVNYSLKNLKSTIYGCTKNQQNYFKAHFRSNGIRQFVKGIEKFANPKHDLVLKKLFASEQNKPLLIDFINKLLPQRKVQSIEYLPTSVETKVIGEKNIILDALCTDTNGSQYILEMQNFDNKDFNKRPMFYASRVYSKQLLIGGKYKD